MLQNDKIDIRVINSTSATYLPTVPILSGQSRFFTFKTPQKLDVLIF